MECHMAHFLHASRTIALLSIPPRFPIEMLCLQLYFKTFLLNYTGHFFFTTSLLGVSGSRSHCLWSQCDTPYPSSLTCDNPAVCWYLVSVHTSKFSPSVHIGLYQAFGRVFPQIFYIFQSLISNFSPYLFIILLLIYHIYVCVCVCVYIYIYI